MKKAVIIGYGNIGKAVLDALKTAKDFTLHGIVSSRNLIKDNPALDGLEIVRNIKDFKTKPDIAIICAPSRSVRENIIECLNAGISTVDAFDIHDQILPLKKEIDPVAKEKKAVSVIASGWDPGSDSILRALFLAMAPVGLTYTNFGPGMSMGHSVAAKAVKGVKKALSMTIPLGTSIHRRMVYVELENGAVFEDVEKAIKSDPYFSKDDTRVILTSDVDATTDMGHGVYMVRKGTSGTVCNQIFEFNMKINNPALTAQVLVASARAALKAAYGCYTLIELPIIDFLEGEKDELIKTLV